jgi:hypothetical protein
MNDSHDPYRDWDGAYVFGMLTPDERRAFERHLAGCPACTTAVAELAGLPGILASLSHDEAVALLDDDRSPAPADAHLLGVAHQPELVQSLARSVRRRRSRVRRGVAALVAGVGAVLAVSGILVGMNLVPAETPAGPPLAMTQVQPGWLDADLTVTEKGWGTRFDWNCSYRDDLDDLDTPVTYDLVVTDAAGSESTVASWSVAGEAAGNLSASTSIPTRDIRSVDIRIAGSTQPIVRTTL